MPPKEIIQDFNEVYEPVFTTDKRYIDIWGGRGRGGSHFGTDYFLFLITQPHYFRGYFVRQVFGDIRDSLFRDFKDRIENNETIDINDFQINENEMKVLYKPTGNIIISKGVKAEGGRTAKMKSLAGATHVLMEEADEVGEDDFDQMDDSLRTVKANIQIIRIFNPPSKDHWWWKRHYVLQEDAKNKGYYKAIPRTDTNLLSIFSLYTHNRINVADSTAQKFESYKVNKPEYYWTVIRGLISEGQRGRIFSGWNKITNEEFNNIDARSIHGLDFGSSSPAGMVEAKVVRNRLYLREQNYEPLTAKQIGIKYFTLKIGQQLIIADSAEPLTIGKLREGWKLDQLTEDERVKFPAGIPGLNIFGVKKVPGSVISGIDTIKDFEVYVTEESTNLWLEYREYKWALDKNKNPTDEPIDMFNHLIDPTRYIVWGKGRLY